MLPIAASKLGELTAVVAEERAGARHTARNAPVAADGAAALLPEPAVRWTFEDEAHPYASTGARGACTLTPVGDVAVVEDDERPGRVLDLAGETMRYLEAETLPEGMPTEGSFTVAFWMRPEGSGGSGTCFYYGAPESGFHLVGYNGWDTFRYTTAVGGDTWVTAYAPYGGAAARKWTHVAAVYDAEAKTRCVYYDGVRAGRSENVEVAGVVARLLYLGRKESSQTQWFKGRLDDVAVWGCALSEAQVVRLCRDGLPRANRPLLPPGTALTVAEGARLALARGADVAAATLDGAGAVALEGAAEDLEGRMDLLNKAHLTLASIPVDGVAKRADKELNNTKKADFSVYKVK